MGDSSAWLSRSGSARRGGAGPRRPRNSGAAGPRLVTSSSDDEENWSDDAAAAASGNTARKKQKKGPAAVNFRASDSEEQISSDSDDAPTCTAPSGKTARKKQKKGPAAVHTFPDATLGVCIEKGLAMPQLVRGSLLRHVCAGKITKRDHLGPIPEFQRLFCELQGLAHGQCAGQYDEEDEGVLFMWPRTKDGKRAHSGASRAVPITNHNELVAAIKEVRTRSNIALTPAKCDCKKKDYSPSTSPGTHQVAPQQVLISR
eukprot:COSAG05_NODE_252_length_12865_cov_30.174761_6_plen_259_part_00